MFDLFVFEVCGLVIVIKNVYDYVKEKVDWVFIKLGGEGVFCEVLDKILEV